MKNPDKKGIEVNQVIIILRVNRIKNQQKNQNNSRTRS